MEKKPITLTDISKSYGDEKVFDKFSIEFSADKINCILGGSGCGKTTLLNVLARITDFEGKIDGVEKDFSYIFQQARLIENLTVYDNIEYVLLEKYPNKAQRKEIIDEFLSLIEMYDDRNKLPKQLSGGMAQRVSMARAFAYPAPVILMDEPFQGLDLALKTRLFKVFFRLFEKNTRTVVMVTHDIYEALLLSDRIFFISGKPANVVFDETITTQYADRAISSAESERIRDRILQLIFR